MKLVDKSVVLHCIRLFPNTRMHVPIM